jgi:hypothetical protein
MFFVFTINPSDDYVYGLSKRFCIHVFLLCLLPLFSLGFVGEGVAARSVNMIRQ